MSKPDFKSCPFCGSSDVGGTALLGTLHISCYRCNASVKFPVVGLTIEQQMALFNTRTSKAS